jgi:hypothetical protein
VKRVGRPDGGTDLTAFVGRQWHRGGAHSSREP